MKKILLNIQDSLYNKLNLERQAVNSRSVTNFIQCRLERGFKAEGLVSIKITRQANAALDRWLVLLINKDSSRRPVSKSEWLSCLILENTKLQE